MLEIKRFDDSQIVLLRPKEGGRKELVATLTGPNREANAKAMAAVDEVRALLDAVDALDGIAEIPYRQAIELAKAADAVRIALGQDAITVR